MYRQVVLCVWEFVHCAYGTLSYAIIDGDRFGCWNTNNSNRLNAAIYNLNINPICSFFMFESKKRHRTPIHIRFYDCLLHFFLTESSICTSSWPGSCAGSHTAPSSAAATLAEVHCKIGIKEWNNENQWMESFRAIFTPDGFNRHSLSVATDDAPFSMTPHSKCMIESRTLNRQMRDTFT